MPQAAARRSSLKNGAASLESGEIRMAESSAAVQAAPDASRGAGRRIGAARAGLIVLSVTIVTLLEGGGGAEADILAIVALSTLWLLAMHTGFATTRPALNALGTHVALIRGAGMGLILTAALAACAPALAPSAAWSIVLFLTIVTGTALCELFATRTALPQRVLLIGPSETCGPVIDEFAAIARRFTIVGVVEDGRGEPGPDYVGPTDKLALIVDGIRPDLVALVPGCNRPTAFSQLMLAKTDGFNVLELAQLYEHAMGRVPVRDLNASWFMSVLHLYRRPYSALAKRAFDIVGVVFLVTLALPLFPILALVVLSNGRPIFFRQVRIGARGRPFTMVKFRTMRVDAEFDGNALWAVQNDPRVTDTGRIMRRFRLDELPQVWNILKGEMSLVGPRPERPEFVDKLAEAAPFWDHRHLVKPGITGWAQINRGYASDTEANLLKLSYDLWYLRHRSLTVDITICARTFASMVRGEWAGQQKIEQPAAEPTALWRYGVVSLDGENAA